jgi:hypothetical protein
MNLLCMLLLACTTPPAEKAPAFDPAGTFELNLSPEQTFTSTYRNQTSDFATGTLRNLDLEENIVIEVGYSKATKTATIDGLAVVLNESAYGNDTGGTDTAEEYWPGRSGTSEFYSEPYGTLSEIIGAEYDLGGADCNISLTNTLNAYFSPTGSDAAFTIEQRYDFDNSATCREALSKTQELIFQGDVIPAFFFQWAYYQGLNLAQLDQIESMSFTYVLQGSKIEDEVTTDAVPTTAPLAASKGTALKRTMINGKRALIGTSKAFRKAASPAILNLYR